MTLGETSLRLGTHASWPPVKCPAALGSLSHAPQIPFPACLGSLSFTQNHAFFRPS
jgi:hypothetical protein